MKKIIISIFLSFVFVPALFATSIIIDDDIRDIHGCNIFAGYSWSIPMKKCIRAEDYYTFDIVAPNTGITIFDKYLQKKSDQAIRIFQRSAEIMAKKNNLSSSDYSLTIRYTMIQSGSITTVVMNTDENLLKSTDNSMVPEVGYIISTSTTFTYNADTRKIRQISKNRAIAMP